MPKTEKQIQLRIKSFFEPREEFIKKTRFLFLKKLESSKKPASFAFFVPLWKYAFAATLIVLFLSGGLVIYADTKDVGAKNPFYGFKKTGENIRLVMAPNGKKPMVNHQIADRRVKELCESKNMDSNMIGRLNEEYKNSINVSLDQIGVLDEERLEKIKELCAKIAQTMQRKVEAVKAADIDEYTDRHFKERCGQFVGN